LLKAQIFAELLDILTPLIELALPLIMSLFDSLTPILELVGDLLYMSLDAWEELGAWIQANMPAIETTVENVFGAITETIGWFMDNILSPLIDGFREFFGVADTQVEPKIDYTGMEFPEKTLTAGLEKEHSALKNTGTEIESTGFEIGEDFANSMAGGIDSKAGAVGDAAMNALGPIEQLFANFNEDIKKQQAKITLQGLGLSDALVEEVLGSGDQWEEAYNTIVKGGEQAAQSLQSLFNQTTNGMDEIAEATAKQEAELEKQRKALEEFNRKAEEYQQDISSLFTEFIPLPTIEEQIGRFENQVIQMFANIDETISRGVEDGLIGEAFESQLRQLADYSLTKLPKLEMN